MVFWNQVQNPGREELSVAEPGLLACIKWETEGGEEGSPGVEEGGGSFTYDGEWQPSFGKLCVLPGRGRQSLLKEWCLGRPGLYMCKKCARTDSRCKTETNCLIMKWDQGRGELP